MNSSYLSVRTADLQTGSRKGDKESGHLYVPEYEVRELKEAYRDDEQRAIGYFQ